MPAWYTEYTLDRGNIKMADLPFLLVLEGTLASGGVGTLQYSVPPSEDLEVHGVVHTSTGTFNITGMRTSDGVSYTNASQSVEIPSTAIPSVANGYNAIWALATPLLVEGSNSLYIDLEDSSAGSNTVTLILNCIRRFKVRQ